MLLGDREFPALAAATGFGSHAQAVMVKTRTTRREQLSTFAMVKTKMTR
jgi:hypothetical protein